ncbi:MAG: alpha-ketoglutarate-dependent dioxygenase AlkB [Gammaproteobacteria bacterium]
MNSPVAGQAELFDGLRPVPEGLVYRLNFITQAEEASLLGAIATLPLREARYKAFTAKRRIVSFGSEYDFEKNELAPAPPLSPFLAPLRDKAADWLKLPAAAFAHALVTEYRPGTALGWQRDAPNFGVTVGISLGGPCRMRFRPYPPKKKGNVFALELAPRSAYLLQGEVRWRWQHSIAPTKTLRHSITFRTLATR